MKRVLGYVTNKGNVTESDAKILTHIHAAFGRLTLEGDILAENLSVREHMADIRRWNPDIKILLSIVPDEPDAFTVCGASAKCRSNVAASTRKVIAEYGFDGVDFDWEYPCVPSNGMNSSPEDKHNYTLLCRAAREGADAAGGGMISVAAGADLYYLESVEPAELKDVLDYICLMTYDLKCGFHALTGHHTPLYSSTGDIFRNSAHQAVCLFEQAGIPREKLLVGAAFYSRRWDNIQDRNNGFLQIAPKGAGYGPGYAELVNAYINKNGYIRYWDDEAKAPYLFNGSTFLSYDDEESIACKCGYVRDGGWGGIFYWDHGSDPSGALLRVMGKYKRND